MRTVTRRCLAVTVFEVTGSALAIVYALLIASNTGVNASEKVHLFAGTFSSGLPAANDTIKFMDLLGA